MKAVIPIALGIMAVLIISGCTTNQEVTNNESNLYCNPPHILFNGSCCIDQNNNSMCDDNEAKCPSSCNDANPCTKDYCSTATDYECVNDPIIPCCGNNECEGNENRDICTQDCRYVPKEDEGMVSEGNVIVIYNRVFGDIARDYLIDTLNCISHLKQKLKIDLSEPARTQFLYLLELIYDGDTGSYATSYGVTTSVDMDWYNDRDQDYFSEVIHEKKECLNIHEIAHVFVALTPIPRWANEGLATYTAEEFRNTIGNYECRENGWYGIGYYGQIKEYPYSNLSGPIEQNGEPGSYWYITAYCFWKYVKENYGEEKVIEIVQELKKNEGKYSVDFFEDIVNKVLGEDITPVTKQRFGVPE